MSVLQKFTENDFTYEQSHAVPAGIVWVRWHDIGETVEFAGRAIINPKAGQHQIVERFRAVDKRLGENAFSRCSH